METETVVLGSTGTQGEEREEEVGVSGAQVDRADPIQVLTWMGPALSTCAIFFSW